MVTELRAQGFWVTKAGNAPAEYEDAFAIGMEASRFAVADGATESCFAKQWSQLLTTGFVASSGCLAGPGRGRSRKDRISEWLAPLQKTWQEDIDWGALPWYAKEKARRGAFAAFLGLDFTDTAVSTGSPRWRAIAVGDCVLFHVRDDRLKTAFPLGHASEFGISPVLLCSNQTRNHAVWREARVKRGDWGPGDLFLLCTDVLAHWFLAQWEAGAKPWSVLCGLANQEDFEELAVELRTGQLVRNDDMTAVIVQA